MMKIIATHLKISIMFAQIFDNISQSNENSSGKITKIKYTA